MSALNTEITYLYRDASNYKFLGAVVVEGKLLFADLERYLIDGLWFIPEQVSMPPLVPIQRNMDDHDWHEVNSVRFTSDSKFLCSASDLLRLFRLGSERKWLR